MLASALGIALASLVVGATLLVIWTALAARQALEWRLAL
jgi:hypothetical protein